MVNTVLDGARQLVLHRGLDVILDKPVVKVLVRLATRDVGTLRRINVAAELRRNIHQEQSIGFSQLRYLRVELEHHSKVRQTV